MAANAFLKLLEEPNPTTTLILTCSEPGALLPLGVCWKMWRELRTTHEEEHEATEALANGDYTAVGAGSGKAQTKTFAQAAWQIVIADVADYLPSYEQNPLAFVGVGARVITGTALLGLGLVKCVFPFALSSTYGPGALPVLTSPLAPAFLLTLAGLGAWLVLGLWLRRRQPLVVLSAALLLGFAFIGSNIPGAVGTIFGERVYYVPSLGVCVLAAWGVQRLREGSPARRAAIAALLVAPVVFTGKQAAGERAPDHQADLF